MTWRMLQDDAWDDDVTALMDVLAATLTEGDTGAGVITSTSIGGDDRPIFMYSVALVGEVVVGVSIDCGTESNVLWAAHVP